MPAEWLVDRTACDGWADILERRWSADLEGDLMAEKWTPGPWAFQADEMPHHPRVGTNDKMVAEVGNAERYIDAIDEWEANAHLIAAAPELYEALEAAYEFIADQYGDAESQALEGEYVSKEARQVWGKICVALAKARAEQ